MPGADFFWFLSTSVDLLKTDARENFSRLTRAMQGLRASVTVSDTHNYVCFEGDRLKLEPEPTRHDIEVKLDDRAVLDLIDGKCSLQQAILKGGIHVKATPPILDKYSSCLSVYLNGALRSPGFPRLLSRYRRAVSSFE